MTATPAAFRGGSGPPLVLLHSGFSTWVEWRALIELLTAERDVFAPTLPGSDGGAPLELRKRTMLAAHADHVEEILDEIGWNEPVQIVGSSFGGVAALELAARGRAGSVLALAPPWVAGPGVAWYAALFAIPLMTLRLTEPFHARLATRPRSASLAFHGSLRPAVITPDDTVALWRSMGRFPFFRTGLAGMRLRNFSPGLPATERIVAPVTLAWGTRDTLAPRWMLHRWRAALPEAQVETLAGFPHVPHLRDPVRIAELIRDAARTTDTATRAQTDQLASDGE